MKDILERIEESSPNESSHELICRLHDCADEISKLRSSSDAAQAPLTDEQIDALRGAADVIAARGHWKQADLLRSILAAAQGGNHD